MVSRTAEAAGRPSRRTAALEGSIWSREIPRDREAEAWASRSTRRTRRFVAARAAARLTAVVVLPTPPLLFTRARINVLPFTK